MTATTLTVNIAGTNYNAFEGTLSLPDTIEQRSECTFEVHDPTGVFVFQKGQIVTVTDTLESVVFYGRILDIKRTPGVGSDVYHQIKCTDRVETLDGQTSNRIYNGQYAGVIAVDQIKDQWANGILASFAVDLDTTQADFQSGNLSGTIAAANVEEGNLELAAAGATHTVVENTTSLFGAGTLTNMTAASNTLGPTATSAMKIQATQSVAAITNSYTYVKFWNAGGITVINGRYLTYDIWISSSSPEAKIGIDLIFTDGSSVRDNAISNNGAYFDAHNKAPHPGTDLGGLAVDTWYHRSFLMDNFTGKTIAYAMIAIEADKPGTYTGYVKNVTWLDSGGGNHGTFFSGSLGVNPPQQMMRQGYGKASVTVVSTYDCSTASRISPSYSIDAVKILKDSYLVFKTTLPANYTFNLEYSIDGGNSYVPCVNNSALPNVPAGLSVAGKTVKFLQSFTQGAGADPTQQPKLNLVSLTLRPSYAATKTDINAEYTTNGQWNTAGTTFSGCFAPANILMPFGAVRNWDDGSLASQTLYGGGATGPNNVNTCHQYVDSKQFRLQLHQLTEARSRMDFAGQWQDFQMEFDVSVDNAAMKVGCVYRTTGWSNYDGTYAYAIEIIGTTIKLFKGSNNGGATGNFAPTQVGSTATVNLTSQSQHRIKVIVNGTTHQIYFDDTLAINTTDATYNISGNVGFRISNTDTVNGYIGIFNNFGISPVSLSGENWTSNSISLTSAGTYGGSVVQWNDISSDPTQVQNNLWSSINGGGSWQICTNGGPIPNLTLGQSLSGVSVLFQFLFQWSSSTILPQIEWMTVYVLGGFSSTGTRINKPLLLSSVGVCGSTLVSWNAITPPGTSITVATSLDGTSYTNVSSGGAIAGINQQPAPTIDSFNLISSGAYTSTARTGGTATSWIWDTTNSRLTVSGGTNALLVYGAISVKDTDVYFDLDQADNCGIVWRWTDASNYYELLIFDASSSAGSTNVLKLFKIVANVKTQIGSNVAITLARSTIVKRVRATMIGTAITIYFDGVSVISTTDSALVGPGKVGFSNVSGIGRLYNLRIQPQGDNLAGKQVFVKETLTTTDPLFTPQITDLTTLVTNPNIAAGSLIPVAPYQNTYKSDNIKDLAKQSNYYWNIKPDGNFIFLPRQTVPSPWVLSSASAPDILDEGIEVDDDAPVYRNRHTLIGVQNTISTSETLTGDGTGTTFTLRYPVVSISSIMLNGQNKTFGLKGTTGKDFYYAVGDTGIAEDDLGEILQKDVDLLVIAYTGATTTTVTRDNTGQFAGTISQKQYLDQSGLSVPVQTILNQASAVINANGNSADLDTSLVKRIAVDVNITAQSGTSPTVRLFVDRKAADGSYSQIWDSGVISALTVVSTSIGPKCTVPEVLGPNVRVRWVIGGTSSPSKTFSISIQGRVDPVLASIGIVEAVEDVSSQNLNVAAAQSLGDSRLQQYGAIGQTLRFKTSRTGLAAGQYLTVFLPSLKLNDASLLITQATRTQMFKLDSGSPSQSYFFDIIATSGPSLGDWQAALNNTLGGNT